MLFLPKYNFYFGAHTRIACMCVVSVNGESARTHACVCSPSVSLVESTGIKRKLTLSFFNSVIAVL